MHLFPKISPLRTLSKVTGGGLLLCLLTALGSGAASAAPTARLDEPRVAVGRNAAASPLLSHARRLGRLDAAAALPVALTLPLRNQTQLAALLRRQYTPGDPLFHQFLKPEEFTAQFGPTQADYDAVASYARAQGLTIVETTPGRTLLKVSGPAAKIESAFGVQMANYQLADGRAAFANQGAPRLPRSIASRVMGVIGLNNLAQMRPMSRPAPRKLWQMSLLAASSDRMRSGALVSAQSSVNASDTGIGSGAGGGLTPNDIKYAYSLSTITPLYGSASATTGSTTLLDGKGQTIGLFELDGYLPADISAYVSTYSLPTVLTGATAAVTPVLLNGFKGTPVNFDDQLEVTLDIEMVLALAPAATGVYVYEAPKADITSPLTIFTKMANDLATDGSKKPFLQVISCSWGGPESLADSSIVASENTLFQQMAAQGQSLFCSSGDFGAYDLYDATAPALTSPEVDNPASQPYATGVGGTTLSYTKPATSVTTGMVTPGLYQSEKAWSSGTPAATPKGSGGGISSLWAKPSYQQGFGASATNRDVPDVALNADLSTGYSIFITQTGATASTANIAGGTSAAAPLWAAYAALINQQRAANGLGTLGFFNPTLYSIGGSSAYSTEFHDVTTGSNLFYEAGPGYDDATGFGSFIGDALLAALSANPNQGTGTATISGTVTDTSTTPVVLAGVTVKAVLVSTGAVAATTTTDTTGAYTLTVPSGVALNLTADPSTITPAPTTGYLTQTLPGLTLTADGTQTENFALAAAHTFAAGLQMISAPFDYTGVGDFAALFGLTVTQASSTSPRLIQYAPSTNSYVFYPTAPADTLRLGQGYWVRFPNAASLHLAGTALAATSYAIPLSAGWNQIGDPFTVSVALSAATVLKSDGTTEGALPSSALISPMLFAYDTTANAYVAVPAASGTLDPYSGYWVYAFQPSTLNVTSGPPSAPGPPPAP